MSGREGGEGGGHSIIFALLSDATALRVLGGNLTLCYSDTTVRGNLTLCYVLTTQPFGVTLHSATYDATV